MNSYRLTLFPKLTLIALCFALNTARADIIFSAKILGPVSNIYALDKRENLKKLTHNNSWRDLEPAKSPQGDLLFLSNRSDKKTIDLHKQSEIFNLFLLGSSKKKFEQLTQTETIKHSPQFSPNGKWISYISNHKTKQSLILINKKTKKTRTLITQEKIYAYSWSPDNTQIAYAGATEKRSNISSINVNSGATKNILTALPNGPNEPNKNIQDNNQHQQRASQQSPQENFISAQWSPNGKHIAYIATSTATKQRSLYVLNLANQISKILSAKNVQVQAPVDWSKESDKILYSGLVGYKFYWDENTYRKVYEGEMNIYLSTLKGDKQKIESGRKLSNRPRFSPNENRIAFLGGDSLSSRDLTLYTMDIKGKKLTSHHSPVPGHSVLHWYE